MLPIRMCIDAVVVSIPITMLVPEALQYTPTLKFVYQSNYIDVP